MRRALVVAHPDDESIWFGGYVLANPGDWTIFCCSIPRVDPIRAWKFYAACEVLGVRGKVLPVTERPPNQPLMALHLLDLDPFDLIVTHGRGPEPGYGHQHVHHAHVHQHVMANFAAKPIRTLGEREQIRLTADQRARKEAALRCYDHLLPYNGRLMPKWKALLHRYCETGGYDLGVETYA